MRRREFIALVAGTAAAWPLVAISQPADIPVIGFLGAGGLTGFANQAAAFRQGLADVGFIPRQNVAIEYRWAEGNYERLGELASELVARRAKLIFCSGGAVSVRAAKAATTTIPIVFTTAVDPIASGIVSSLNRQQGNITGVSYVSGALSGKRLELMKELLPNAKTVAALRNPRNPSSDVEEADIRTAAGKLGLQLQLLLASTKEEIDQAFTSFDRNRPDVLVVLTDLLLTSQFAHIIELAGRYRMPTMYNQALFTKSGGLVSYGASPSAAYRQAGVYAGEILKGAKPADLPVLLPSKFELIVNLKTAKALGLEIPESFLLYRADEVIE